LFSQVQQGAKMGIFDFLNSNDSTSKGVISTGRQKETGGHDHRTNKGDDRTPAQKKGDKEKKK
jgi:hypothetical protein